MLILVFNLYGYRFVIACMQKNSVAVIEQQVDKSQYNDAELISIKTTLNLPYYTSSAEYERAYGSITIDGKEYEYVKRRVYQGTLELLCLPNNTKTKLQKISNEVAQSLADGQATTPAKKSGTVLKISLPDLFQPIDSNLPLPYLCAKQAYFFSNATLSLAGYSTRQERPPQSTHLTS